MAPAHKSIVWSFFFAKDGIATCNICQANLKYRTSTSSLLTHVKSKHPIQLGEVHVEKSKEFTVPSVEEFDVPSSSSAVTAEEKPRKQTHDKPSVQPTLPAAIENRKIYDASSPRRQELDRILLEMITTDLQPFSVVDDVGFNGFKRYSKALDPRYELPSRTKLSTSLLPQIYNEEKKKVFDALQEATAVSLTTDIRSSRAMQGYMTVTAHFISNDWNMKSHVLETFRMVESHTAENIASKLTRVMEEWQISDKISAVVTDSAANVVKATLGLFRSHLVVKTALKDAEDVKPVIDAVKEIVNFFHHSVKASDSLRELQSQQIPNQPHPFKLINDVPTRWNSTYYMLERYLKLHTQVTTALCLSGRSKLCLGSETVDLIRLWIPDLQPFEMVTKEISAEKTTTTAKIIPIVQLLHEALTTNGNASRLAQELQKQLWARFPAPQCKFLWAASTFLDPRFKKHAFTDQSALQDVQEALKGRMKPVDEQETRPRNDEEVSQATNSF
ncbi:zinc finger BED domain-containing protein 1 [Elysia marginata]|uniref:Zinc finger BED domain-containing protein 1 n=1 Tax=Elysia marginata TaxID=1093978 RepID=A0AAV4GW59_9GAST|nr:zinc finger BED domain-containing protein 1 [Elysia marginata]